MAKVKTYWDEIKDEETHFYGGSSGWEVHLRWVESYKWDSKKGVSVNKKRLELQWPWSYGDKLPKGEKAQTRKDVMLKKKIRKMLAQASPDREMYDNLCNRTAGLDHEQWGEIFNMGLKGFDLGNWIHRQYLTHGEAHSLFYHM